MAISMTISTLNSYPSLKPSPIPFKTHKFRNHFPQLTSSFPKSTTQSFNSRLTHAFPSKKFGNSLFGSRNNNLGYCLNSQNGNAQGESWEGSSEAEIRDFSRSSLPEKFKYTPRWKPRWWIYVLALSFLAYSREIIALEMGNWRKWAIIALEMGNRSKWASPIVSFLTDCLEVVNIRDFYKGIITSAPIGDLTLIIVLASIVLAIAEAAVPDSMNSQPYIMTIAGLAGYAAVKGFITATFFSTILMGLFLFSRFIKKKDYVSSTLPVAAVLAAVAEPWARFVVMVSFLALAISHHWKYPSEEKEREANSMGNSLPFPLVCAGLAIGLRVAVKWAHYRHLTWMIV